MQHVKEQNEECVNKTTGSIEIGQILDGKVKGIKDFGAFVELPNGEVGLVHISQISSQYVERIEAHLSEGQQVKVKVLNLEETSGRKKISLSIRQAVETCSGQNQGDFSFRKSRSTSTGKFEKQKSDNFENMLAKFRKDSDEKMSDLSRRSDAF